jgi:hypothetical protein
MAKPRWRLYLLKRGPATTASSGGLGRTRPRTFQRVRNTKRVQMVRKQSVSLGEASNMFEDDQDFDSIYTNPAADLLVDDTGDDFERDVLRWWIRLVEKELSVAEKARGREVMRAVFKAEEEAERRKPAGAKGGAR